MNIFRLDDIKDSDINKQERAYNSLITFLNKHSITSNVDTHTSWGWKNGKYHIPLKDNKVFIKLYSSVIKHGTPNNVPLTITEKPLEYSPVYIDIDFKVNKNKHNINEGLLYDNTLLKKIIRLYYINFKKYLNITDSNLVSIIFEKDGLEDKKMYWGNGIHIIFPNIYINSKLKHIIRRDVIEGCKKSELFKNFDNKPEDIIDESVISRNKIMLYGSKKPDSKYYYNFTKLYNHNCDDMDITDIFNKENIKVNDIIKTFSLRKNNYTEQNKTILRKQYDTKYINNEYMKLGLISSTHNYNDSNLNNNDDNIIDAKYLITLLSDNRAVDYNTWSAVAFCLHNISRNLLNTFIEFSARADNITPGTFSGKTSITKFWHKINLKQKTIGIGSLYHWAKIDNPKRFEEFINMKKKSAMESNMNELPGEYQLAKTFKLIYKNRFVCSNLENKTIWWEFNENLHRWEKSEGGYKIKSMIPEEYCNEWIKFRMELGNKITNPQHNNSDNKMAREAAERISKIISSLYRSSTIDSLTKLLSNQYYDKNFNYNIDELNHNLIGFNNGIFDLDNMEFREGRPDDYISFSTNIDYIPYDSSSVEIKEICNFFDTILVNKNVREYFLTVLSTCLHGENKEQKFWICTGSGSNGKSVTFDLLKKAFGTYFITPRVELFTRKSVGSGQANESMCDLKAKRIAVLQEPDDGEKIHSGTLKPLVAGNDQITARRLFQGNISFTPKCRFFMTANDKPEITDTSDGTWRRIRVIDFKSKFVNKPANKCNKKLLEFPIDFTLSSKLDIWAPHFISMLIHKYYPIYSNGKLKEPEEVKLSTDQYQLENNFYKLFFQEKIIITDNKKDKLSNKDMWEEFKEWFNDDDDREKSKFKPKRSKLLEAMNRFLEQQPKKYYTNVKFKLIEDDEESSNETNIDL